MGENGSSTRVRRTVAAPAPQQENDPHAPS